MLKLPLNLLSLCSNPFKTNFQSSEKSTNLKNSKKFLLQKIEKPKAPFRLSAKLFKIAFIILFLSKGHRRHLLTSHRQVGFFLSSSYFKLKLNCRLLIVGNDIDFYTPYIPFLAIVAFVITWKDRGNIIEKFFLYDVSCFGVLCSPQAMIVVNFLPICENLTAGLYLFQATVLW